MKTLAIANAKGGVGKTATAHNLGALLAADGFRVLLLDGDPQASLTQACGLGDVGGRSLAEVLGGSVPGSLSMAEIIQDLGDGLFIAPADITMAAVELGLTSRLGRENVLKKSLVSVADSYDVCIIDCAPSLGLLVIGSLVAADGVLVPSLPQVVDLRGLRQFLETTENIRAELNPDLELLGVVITFYDGRLKHHQAAVKVLQEANIPLVPVFIGRSVRVAEAAGSGQPVSEFAPQNPQTENYKQLTEEIKRWLKHQG